VPPIEDLAGAGDPESAADSLQVLGEPAPDQLGQGRCQRHRMLHV
jgi:hypothetical protein